jgi:hypothetical protein
MAPANKNAEPGSDRVAMAAIASTTLSAAVPMKTPKNQRLSTTTLIDCMAAIP